jgi:hypothetical protein
MIEHMFEPLEELGQFSGTAVDVHLGAPTG